MANERQINSLPGILAVKMIRQQISLTNRLTHQSINLTNKRRQWRTRTEQRLPPLMRGLDIHRNIQVSDTNLTLGLLVGFISSHFTADKLLPVNSRAITGSPKMSLLPEAISMPALIIKPMLILVMHKVYLIWYIKSNQQGQMIVQTSTGLSACQMLRQGRSCIAPQKVFQLTWCSRRTFLLTHKCRTAWAIDMTADKEEWSELPIGATTGTRSGTSVISRPSVPPLAWVGPTTNWSHPETIAKSKAAILWQFVVVEPRWWPFKSPINRKEAQTSSACTAAIDPSKQLKFRSFRSRLR